MQAGVCTHRTQGGAGNPPRAKTSPPGGRLAAKIGGPTLQLLLLLLLLTPAFAQYDLLLRGGHVIDPRNNIDGRPDLAIQACKIAEVSASIDPPRAHTTIDASSLY